MMGLKPQVVAAVVVSLAIAAAVALQSVSDISVRRRQPEAFPTTTARAAGAPATAPDGAAAADRTARTAGADGPAMALRLVDTGGVGMPLDGGEVADHSHARRVFHDLILKDAPYVDAVRFGQVEADWHEYVDRMIDYGSNAMAVPLLLELIDFDRVGAANGTPVYGPASPFPPRHQAVRRQLAPLFDWTEQRGMQVYLQTDMLALTPPLLQHLRALAPDRKSAVGIDTSNPAVWATYRAGLEELFDKMPSISGLVIRIGEGGSLYNVDQWPYQSEPGVRSAQSVRAMLRGLLPVFEARHKTLVLRSWTVGVGPLGRLHIDPRVYESVLGDLDSPALVISTKYTAGDFFSYLPLNPTLASGRHRRLIELQARPEFEGFGAFPDFLGAEYARALRTLRAANPRIEGTFLFTQFGGPRRNGRRTLYPFHGFWLWTDANAYVASKLALDPNADVDRLARQWARTRFGADARLADVVAGVLNRTRHAVLTGFYIRPFAEREVRVPGLELPPLMWIFEWDMVGGWHSLLSLVSRTTRDDVGTAIAEGHAAADTVRAARQELQAAFAAAPPASCARFCDEVLHSLEYQETLFDALAAWRQSFLSYYRWLDTGDARAWQDWRAGRAQFDAATARHVARFGHDLDFPAFDLSSATRAVTFADRGGWIRLIAVVVLLVVAALAVVARLARVGRVTRIGAATRAAGIVRIGSALGRLLSTAAIAPWRLVEANHAVDTASAVALTTLVVTMVALLVASLTSFATPTMAIGSSLPLIAFALAFERSATGVTWGQGRGRLLVASVGPLVPGLIILFAILAYLGPVGFWYGFWTSRPFRIVLFAIAIATLLWTGYVMIVAASRDGGHGRAWGVLAAMGAGLVALTMLMPDWIDVLRFLDHPLNLAPATETMLFALRTYAGVRLGVGKWSLIVGGLLLAGGWDVFRLRRRARRMERRFRQARMLGRAFRDRYAPVNVHIIPMRRCNISCAYCNEYDDHSAPIPIDEVRRRIDALADLGTGIVTISGGEPLMHPDLDAIIRHIRSRGMIATAITNAYLLNRDRIGRLNRAGLDHLQISIDNVAPDDVSKKSLKLLDTKLQWLATDAIFDVTINAVVGGGVQHPEDALTIARRARALGFSATVGIIHDHRGQLQPLDPRQRAIVSDIVGLGDSVFDVANYNLFQKNLASGAPNDWHCRAGARYLYVCENGLVHWCSQQRGQPGIALAQYTPDDLERQYHAPKACAPFCTVGCVHRVAQVDALRARPIDTLVEWFAQMPGREGKPMPFSVRALTWMFVTSPHKEFFRGAAARVLGIK